MIAFYFLKWCPLTEMIQSEKRHTVLLGQFVTADFAKKPLSFFYFAGSHVLDNRGTRANHLKKRSTPFWVRGKKVGENGRAKTRIKNICQSRWNTRLDSKSLAIQILNWPYLNKKCLKPNYIKTIEKLQMQTIFNFSKFRAEGRLEGRLMWMGADGAIEEARIR